MTQPARDVANDAPHQAAYQAGGHAVSRERFYAIACDPKRSVVVEACAGAGKTWMLVSRILRALLDGARPHEILAITFTRKAAGEMRDRLNDWLREFGSPTLPHADRIEALIQRGVPASEAPLLAPALAALHERVLRSGRPVEIRTFHAWFSQLLKAAPLELLEELGLQQEMELIEDIDDHRADVFRRFHAAVLRDPALHADHSMLVAYRGRSQARKWLEAVIEKRVEFELADNADLLAQSVPAPELARDDAGAVLHPGHALRRAAWMATLRELMLLLGEGGVRAQDAATGLVMALAETDPRRCFDHAWSALFTLAGTPRKQLGKVPELGPVQDALAEIGRDIHQLDAHDEHLRMVRLGRALLTEYAAYKKMRGLIDMADLERGGLALLRDATLAGWVQERLDARIRHVLIDEFQDTSPLQWHALHSWLAAYAGAGGGSSGQHAPGVFIVGDPKQSIYRFRRAEPRVFEAARAFVVEALDGSALACDHTRRNAPEILRPLNAVFAQAQRAGDFDGFRSHTTEVGSATSIAIQGRTAGLFFLPRVLRPARSERGTAALSTEWRDTLTTPRHEPEEVLREREASLVAESIASLLNGGECLPGEIFVLSRKRESLRLVADALLRFDVPYAAVENFELMAAPEARDLVALLDVLVSPRHKLSLAQVLRSPLFGASDSDLIDLAERAERMAAGDWWFALMSDEGSVASTESAHEKSPGEAAPRAWPSAALRRARKLLARWRIAARALPPHDLLDRIVAEGELRERVAATVPPVQRTAALDAIDAVLGQALQLDGARYSTPYNFVRALKRRAITVAPPTHADAVQLLTVHGAKGLEAEIVFVMDSDPEPKATETTTLLIDWPVEAEAPRRCAFVYSEGACPPSLTTLLAAEVAARQREELNGLYVAMTRAKRQLVFSATEPSRTTVASWWDRVSPLASPMPISNAPSTLASLAPSALAREHLPPPAALLNLPALSRPERPEKPPGRAEPPEGRGQEDGDIEDTDATRLGKAVHRTLEWATTGAAPDADLPSLAAAAAREFAAPVVATTELAARILQSPACARFFRGAGLLWAGNEVPVGAADDTLRIDRLVQLKGEAGLEWWVLDYKLQHAPEQVLMYRDQLLRYRSTVQALQPGDTVRCAFITGAGGFVEIP